MIRTLHLRDVGPAHELKLDLAPRLNVLTGDNGLGKTFVLDVAWWLLTTTWAGEVAFPRRAPDRTGAGAGHGSGDGSGTGAGAGYSDGTGDGDDPDAGPPGLNPTIAARLGHRAGELAETDVQTGGSFEWTSQAWERHPYKLVRKTAGFKPREDRHEEASFRPASLVVYVRHDGSFALWDAYAVSGGVRTYGEAALTFTPDELWDGKQPADVEGKRRPPLCRGLIEDWRSWQLERDPTFSWLRRALDALSEPGEPLVPGEPAQVKITDDRKIPTLDTSYGEVPVTLASAGVKRVLGIAYLLVWAWQRHTAIAKLQKRTPTQDMVVLVDEVELHLHPQWQRTILPALLKAIGTFAPNVGIQLIATTHAPLVLASLEPHFLPEHDALFTFDLKGRKSARRVVVEKARWRRFGDASNWLTSHVFDLKIARSREAEIALERAMKALDNPDLAPEEAREIHRSLHEVLRDTDPFWGRWMMVAEKLGIEP